METTQPVEVLPATPEPRGTPIFRVGDRVEINGGIFRIKSFGHTAMLLENVSGKKPTLEDDLPIQTRIENCEHELKTLIKLRDK